MEFKELIEVRQSVRGALRAGSPKRRSRRLSVEHRRSLEKTVRIDMRDRMSCVNFGQL